MDQVQEKRPKQARSRETRRRLLAAARRLVEERDWKDISMGEIAREGQSSVGSLYARFANKQDLFDALDDQYAAELKALMQSVAGQPSGSLEAHLEQFVSAMARFHRTNRGLIRALVLAARIDQSPAFTTRTEEMNRSAAALVESFLRRAAPGLGSDAVRRTSWMIFIVMTMVRERILFPESVSIVGNPDDTELVAEVVRAAQSYMEAAP